MSVQSVTRKFVLKVNSKDIILEDINDELSVDEIKDVYSTQYPQLLNSQIIEKGIDEEGFQTYEFKTIAGTKG